MSTPSSGTPSSGTPSSGTPSSGTPAAGTPAAGTPAAGTPAAGTPAAGTPAAGTPAAGTTDLVLPRPEDTAALGCRLGAALAPGDLVVLAGPLGAGKTCLAAGLGDGLGVEGPVTSPTFVIAREHPSRPDGRGVTMVHVDAYRLGGVAELDDLDLDTDLTRAVVVVEWGEGVAEHLVDEHLLVRLERHADDHRTATLAGPRRLVDAGCPPA